MANFFVVFNIEANASSDANVGRKTGIASTEVLEPVKTGRFVKVEAADGPTARQVVRNIYGQGASEMVAVPEANWVIA